MTLLPSEQEQALLLIVWLGALAGVAFRVFWVGAPRWLYTPVYVALGWVALFYLPSFLHRGGPGVLALIAVGGSALHARRAWSTRPSGPNPSPRWFGFHEIFHVFTVAAFVVHYVAVSMSVYPRPALARRTR